MAASSESIQWRSCSGGWTPWKLSNGRPAASAMTAGTASIPNIEATRDSTSTLIVASDHVPPSAAAIAASTSTNAMQASLRGDHSTTITGT